MTKPGSSDARAMDITVVSTAGIMAAITIAATEVRTLVGAAERE